MENEWTYKIYLHGEQVGESQLKGIAFLVFESAKLLGLAELHEVYVGPNYDPVLHSTIVHRGGLMPPCNPKPPQCKYRKSLEREYYSTPRPTAFRVEIMCPSDKCGYMLKPSKIGGDFFDYANCIK